jgi:uncharacterized membrane protein
MSLPARFVPRVDVTSLDKRLEWIWLSVAGPVAFCLALLTPPFQAPDEDGHFVRACQVAGGIWLGTMSPHGKPEAPAPTAAVTLTQIPGYAVMRTHHRHKIDVVRASEHRPDLLLWDGTVTRIHNVTLLYVPTSYATAALGIVIGKSLGLGVLHTYYLARLSVCFTSLLLSFAALRLATGCRWFLFLILSLPTTLFLFGSLHQDANLIAATAFGVAVLSRMLVPGEPGLGVGSIVAGLLALGYAALCKYTYVPLFCAALVLLFIRTPSRWKLLVATGSGVFAVLFAWILANREISAFPIREGTNPSLQMAWVTRNPGTFVINCMTDVYVNYRVHADTAVGVLGWLDTWMPRWSLISLQCTLIAALVLGMIGYARARRSFGNGLIIASAALASIGLVYLSQYLLWNRVGVTVVEGMQGRYLLPILLFCALLSYRDSVEKSGLWFWLHRVLEILSVGLVAVVGLTTCLRVLWRYY